ncbi:MAG TPA: hypothetical protein DCY35_06340 [Prolixibacteraceae bacterium]|nr:hypothetical protein [Prolixibacteraceae bacterium]
MKESVLKSFSTVEKRDVFNQVLMKMDDFEQESIEKMAKNLVILVKERSLTVQISKEGAMELLGSIGIFMNEGIR